MKKPSFKWLGQFVLVMAMTVVLVMARALLLTKLAFPTWFLSLSGLAYLVFTAYLLLILIRYDRQIWTVQFAKYLAYFFGGLYLVNLVYRLNAKAYEPWNIVRNNLFQLELLAMVFLPVLVWLLLRRWPAGRQRLLSLGDKLLYPDSYLLLASFLSLSPLAVSYWKDSHYQTLVEKGTYQAFFQQTPVFASLHVLAYYVFLVYLVKAYQAFRANRTGGQSMAFISLVLAILSHIGYQASMAGGTGAYFSRHLFPGAIVFQVFCLFLLNVFISLVLNRQVLSVALIASLNISLITINFLKFRYRSEPLTPNDFKWIGNAGMLLSFISLRAVLVSVLAIVVLALVYVHLRNRFFQGPIISSLWKRLVGIGTILAVIFGMGFAIRQEKNHQIWSGIPILSQVNNWRNVDWKGYAFVARYRTLSFLWLQQLSKSSMEEPEDYSEKSLRRIARKYSRLAETINQNRPNHLTDQTVIYVLSESLADPSRLPGLNLSHNVLPNIQTIMGQTTSGLMKSDHYGGGTANIEFQVYSGLPFYNYSSSISSVYLDVVPKMKKLPSISDLYPADNRVGIHPYFDTSYNRNMVYKQLGIAHFYSLNSLTHPIAVTADDYLGNFVSDQKTYDLILDQVKAGQSRFISAITMQNHVQWRAQGPAEIIGTGPGFTVEENANLTSYVRLLSQTDKATQAFLDQLKQLDQKVTLVFFGDHLPGLYPESTFAADPSLQYKTDYFIWSNFETQAYHYELIGPSDLNALMLETTGNKVSPYYALLTEVLHKDRVGQTNRDQDLAADLRLVQYDLSRGKGYLLKEPSFFEIPVFIDDNIR